MRIVIAPSGGPMADGTHLIRQAKEVLDFNWTGRYTKPGPGQYTKSGPDQYTRPSPSLYPHQWSWDSAFIAIGYAHYAQDRAMQELRHLFESQWENGLLPQIVYDPHFSMYFPGIDFWCVGGNSHYPCDRKTSGVVQPPVHATAVLRIYQHAKDLVGARDFLEYAYPHLKAWHEYLYRERDPEGEGLVYIRHPWESGMDNSPLWDGIMQRLRLRRDQIPSYRRADTQSVAPQDRPDGSTYDRFAWLVQLFAKHDYDEAKIRRVSPFLVQDVLFNAVLYQADHDLAEIARILGEDPFTFEERADKSGRAIDQKLWNEEHGTYLDFDLVADRQIYAYTASNFVPCLGASRTRTEPGA
jgi:mannosylglycerate hydrolase